MDMRNDYRLGIDFGMASVAARERELVEVDEEIINESITDFLKPITLATLIAAPGIVDAESINKKFAGGDVANKVVNVSDPKVQQKIYDATGKDKYLDLVIINVIARTLMAEAVGEKSKKSFRMVASVIWNRAGGDKNKFIDVIWSPSQFSCWKSMTDSDKRNFVVKPHGKALTNPSAWKYCMEIATDMVNGTFQPDGKWKQYYAHNKVTPTWANKLVHDKKVYKGHTFGNF